MSFVKPLLWLAGIALSVVGVVLTVREPPRVMFPPPSWLPAGSFFGASAALFVYSLFVEIPFASAYVQKGTPSRLVTTGTYALCRHPGVLWLAGLLAGVFFASGSLWMLVALPLWVGQDVLYVVLQEKLYFFRIFGAEYRATSSPPRCSFRRYEACGNARTRYSDKEESRRIHGNVAGHVSTRGQGGNLEALLRGSRHLHG